MAEYISKQKVTDRLGCCLANAKAEYKAAKDEFTKARFGDYISAIQAMIDVVECTKAADVQPVKHGYWKEEEPRVLKCSVCGEYAPMNYLGQNCIDSRYCPWCGTKMDSNADEPWQSE